jgi:hypothetical protein
MWKAIHPIPNPDPTPTFTGDPAANPDAGITRGSLYSNGAHDGRHLETGTTSAFNLSGQSWTFEGWFQHGETTPSGWGDIIGGTRDHPNYGGFTLRLTSANGLAANFFEGGSGGDGFGLSSTDPVTVGDSPSYFHHFALTWEDDAGANSTGLAELWIDGAWVDSADAPTGFSAAIADSNDMNQLIIGGRTAASGENTWEGRLDEFRWSDQVLQPWQFLNGSGLPPTEVIPEPSTLLIWTLLAGLGIGAGWRRRKR